MTKQEFLSTHTNYKIVEQYKNELGGGILVEIYDTTWTLITPIFRHFISQFDLDNSLLDYEHLVMTPILNWYNNLK